MNASLDPFILVSAGVLTIAAVFAGATAVAAHVLYRSVRADRQIATLRVLGARRSQIVRMLLTENVLGIVAGVLGGVAVLIVADQHRVGGGLTLSAALVATAAMCGGWLAARHASKTPFSASGLFRTPPDRRGQD
jgi:predicted lysophospholipase L1 biosynthesis ABC-type transport system permease subunit